MQDAARLLCFIQSVIKKPLCMKFIQSIHPHMPGDYELMGYLPKFPL